MYGRRQEGIVRYVFAAGTISYFTHICTECAVPRDLQSENWFLGNIENKWQSGLQSQKQRERGNCILIC